MNRRLAQLPMRQLTIPLGLAFFSALLGMAIVLLWQPDWLITRLADRSPAVLYYVETTEPLVALTIDDGPDPETTPKIIDVLAAHRAQDTFFLISSRIAGNELVVERIVQDGHEIGNHLSRDEPSIKLSASQFEEELLESHAILSQFAAVSWMRPGGGWYNDAMLLIAKGHDYRCALGSIYPYDAELAFPAYAAFHVLRRVRPGSVIILHDGGGRGRRTAAVLRRVLPELSRRGLRVVTLSELVELAQQPSGRGVSGSATPHTIGPTRFLANNVGICRAHRLSRHPARPRAWSTSQSKRRWWAGSRSAVSSGCHWTARSSGWPSSSRASTVSSSAQATGLNPSPKRFGPW